MDHLKWQGADNGREGLLRADKWFKTLAILGNHEGELITDYNGSLYEDLFHEMPDESWLGKDRQRSLFRDYQKSWTSLGVLRPTGETDQVIELTNTGHNLIKDENVVEFFRTVIDNYLELWDIVDGPVLVSPYEVIAHALLRFPEDCSQITVRNLKNDAESIASACISSTSLLTFDSGDVNTRRFRSYLIVFENAKAIALDGNGMLRILDREYLETIAKNGMLTASLSSIVVDVSLEETRNIPLPDNIAEDFRKRRCSEKPIREGQARFSKQIKEIYRSTCCITGATETTILQAAHILPYRGRQTNFPNNGLLLAQDVHTMFDRGRLLINPDTLCVEFASSVTDLRYLKYAGNKITVPEDKKFHPSYEALKRKYELSINTK